MTTTALTVRDHRIATRYRADAGPIASTFTDPDPVCRALDAIESQLAALTTRPNDGLLALIDDVAEAKDLRDKAEALRTYARQAMKGQLVTNRCCYLKLCAEHQCGRLVTAMEKYRGRPAKASRDARLSDLGINYSASSRWQLLAELPVAVLHTLWIKADIAGEELTSAAAYREAKAPGGAASQQSTPPA